MTAPSPRTDTDTALDRIQADATEHGIKLYTTEHWSACACEDGTHEPWMKRVQFDCAAEARDWAAARPGRRHVVRNHRLDGYTPWAVPR